MWNLKNKQKNRFLHMRLPNFEADVVNDYIFEEFRKISDERDSSLNLRSIQPVKAKIIGEDRTSLAFGNWRLPKIVRDICSDDVHVQLCAMKKLRDLMSNTLERERAIIEFGIVGKLKNILFRRLYQTHKDQRLILVILRCYEILAWSFNAALDMSEKSILIGRLYIFVGTSEYGKTATSVLRILTQHPQVVDFFVYHTKWFDELCRIFEKNSIEESDTNLLEHLSHFLEVNPQMALKRGFFEKILPVISNQTNNQNVLLKCFALLMNCMEGQEKLDKSEGVRFLCEMIIESEMESYEFVAQALQNATVSSRTSLWKCSEFSELPQALLRRAHDKSNERQQAYCLQTMLQICAVPSVKHYIWKNLVPQIQTIECRNETVRRVKEKLLARLKREVFRI